MTDSGDNVVWELCLEGDRRAFETLYRTYFPVLLNYGKLFTSDTDLVESCIQDFFLKLISNRFRLSLPASVRSYLLKGFRHTLYNRMKAEQRRRNLLTDYPDNILDIEAEHLLDEEDLTPRKRLIVQALKELSRRQREILYLYYIRELSHEEIADLLDIDYQSSKNLLFRSVAKLRKLLEVGSR